MTIQEEISLQAYNTFGVDVKARLFMNTESIEDLQIILKEPKFEGISKLFLGGGSNILFTKDYDGLVVKLDIKGIDQVKEDDDFVWLKAGAGENWHNLVLHSIEKNLGGLENLSLIPGTVGAAPMQNIGAYGVEIKDTFHELVALNIVTGELKTFNNAECEFAYRHSIFKGSLKDQFVIVSVTFRLAKKPIFKTSYGDILKTLEKSGETEITLKSISDAIIEIRRSKLPDPLKIGNAGSFFKNPVVEKSFFSMLQKDYPDIPGYTQADTQVKVPAGWLIEQCGWKGKTVGNVGVHENQALVLVNRGGAKGEEVKQLSETIIASVGDKFGIALSPEVNFV